MIVVNEHPCLGCMRPRASGHQTVSSVRSLGSAGLSFLNQLASVFPARLKLFRTNGPVVLTAMIQNGCTANKNLDKLFKSNFKDFGTGCIYIQLKSSLI